MAIENSHYHILINRGLSPIDIPIDTWVIRNGFIKKGSQKVDCPK